MAEKHILLIEDDRDILEVLKDLLESEGYQVTAVENGQEAFNFLNFASELPDLILVDLMMPVMDGFRFRELQRTHERFKRIPVVVMSADGQIEPKKERLGVDAFLKKPLDLELFLNTIIHQWPIP